MWIQSLGWEDPLEKEMATHSSILAWRIPWQKEPGGLQSKGSQRLRHEWVTEHAHTQHPHRRVLSLPLPSCSLLPFPSRSCPRDMWVGCGFRQLARN